MDKQATDYLNFDREEVEKAIAEDGGVPDDVLVMEDAPVRRNAQGMHMIGRGGPGRREIPQALFNEQDWPAAIARRKQEKYEHRIIAFYRAQGFSGVEIAAKMGCSPGTVYQILKLPWVKQAILEVINEEGRDAVQETLRATSLDTIHFFIEARDDQKAQLRDRISAGKELLDRLYGKASQPIIHREETDLDKLSDQQLAEIVSKASTAGSRGN